jgi:hypothetical protein
MVEGTAAPSSSAPPPSSRAIRGATPRRGLNAPSSLLATPTVTGESALTRTALDGQVVLVLERELPQAITRGPRGDQNCHRAAFSLDASINIPYLGADINQNTLYHTRPCQAVRSRAKRKRLARGRGRNERELQRLTGRMGAETTASSGVSRMRLPAT